MREIHVKSPGYEAHANRKKGHGFAAEQILGSIVLFRAEEAKVNTDENADAQQTTEQDVVGPSEGEFLQLVTRKKRFRAIGDHPGFVNSR